MEVIAQGLKATAQNTVGRLGTIFVWLITKAGALLLKLPLASIRFLARIGSYLLDSKNRKVVTIVLTTAAVVIASRTLVNKANRNRIKRESGKLFSRFHSRFTSRLNLMDADDEELLKAKWDLDQLLKTRQMQKSQTDSLLPPFSRNSRGGLRSLNKSSGVHFEHRPHEDRLTEIESTVSGNSHDIDIRRLNYATKALSSRPSLYQQTKYLDEIEEVLKKRKRSKYTAAEKFLNNLTVKKSEALASNILQENLIQRQDQPGFEQTISKSRQQLLTLNHLERLSQDHLGSNSLNRSMDDLTEQDESNYFEYASDDGQCDQADEDAQFWQQKKSAAATKSQGATSMVKKLDGKSEQLFFEFFGMYTKESIKSHKQTGMSNKPKHAFNTRAIELSNNDTTKFNRSSTTK